MAPPLPPYKTFETVNFYTGSSLNRLSWMRTDSDFLNQTLASPHTRILLLQNLNPLAHKGGEQDGYLATVSWGDVREQVLQVAKQSGHDGTSSALFGPQANGVKPPSDGDAKATDLFDKSTAGMVPTGMVMVFLGIDEEGQNRVSLPGHLAHEAGAHADAAAHPAGIPYFALSLTYRSKQAPTASPEAHPFAQLEKEVLSSGKYEFVDTRSLGRAGDWPMKDAAMVAQARALVDWNERNHFCPACSRKQHVLWAGYKRACSSALSGQLRGQANAYTSSLLRGDEAQDEALGECPSTTQLSNFSYPRTDPVVIMGVLSPDGERLLLGRQKKWPRGFWSCLAGFIEPGESLEEAVRREVLEESGVTVDKVVYHSSQSWPFPCQLMEGCYGIAASPKASSGSNASNALPEFKLDLDNELEAAQWFTREEILAVLDRSAKSHLSKQDINKIDQATQKSGGHEQKDPGSIANTDNSQSSIPDDFKIPPATAIAHVLIAAWARREAILPLSSQSQARQGRSPIGGPVQQQAKV
ncbi:unnamed protein product [Parajaminaea phylloscopi]